MDKKKLFGAFLQCLDLYRTTDVCFEHLTVKNIVFCYTTLCSVIYLYICLHLEEACWIHLRANVVTEEARSLYQTTRVINPDYNNF